MFVTCGKAGLLRGPGVLVALLVFALLVGCRTSPPGLPKKPAVPVTVYEQAKWVELPGWGTDNVQEAWQAFLSSCRALRFQAEWAAPCAAAQTVPANSAASVREYFERMFEPYKIVRRAGRAPGEAVGGGQGAGALRGAAPGGGRSAGAASGRGPGAGEGGGLNEDTGLITGYFEPQLFGSRAPSARFVAPLYTPPPDLLTVDLAVLFPELKGKRVRGRLDGNKVVPYYTRGELATDAALKGHELVWIDSAFEAMMLEVQGSGRVQLPDGKVIRVQYADQNGQPYHSIGRYLVTIGALAVEEANIPGIRAWLVAHPERLREVLDANPSVVFFSEAPLGDPNLGPKGAEGIALTAGRSVAVDPAWIPLGTPVFLATTLPDSGTPLQRLVIAQDTGGAIGGAPRADYFCGSGPQAADLAGKMRQQGSLWLVWPRDVPLPKGPAGAGLAH